jgi:molybdopterin converting factor small subunit
MQCRINVEVSLFGAFRQLAESSCHLELPHGASLRDVRDALKKAIAQKHPEFAQKNLLDISALADETTILRNDHVLMQDTKLAIIPPISGG